MTVTDVYRALWRHKLVVLVLTAVLGAVAYYLSSSQQDVYQARSLMRIESEAPTAGDALVALAAGQKLAQTYAEIAGTDRVAVEVARTLRLPATAVAGTVSAEAVQDLDLLWVTAKSHRPLRAQLIANTVPQALATVLAATGTRRERVVPVESAGLPTSPSSPRPIRTLILAIVAGLVLNSGLVLLIHAIRDPIHDPDEARRLTGLPVLATIPSLRLGRSRVDAWTPGGTDEDALSLRETLRG